MQKRQVTNLASVVIIARASDPSQIFAEVKDDGYPAKVFRRRLCLIGGNWIGETAKNDQHPLDTVRREVDEELALEATTASTLELALLGLQPERSFYRVAKADLVPDKADRTALATLKRAIIARCTPLGDWMNTMPKAVFDAADPENTRDGWTSLVSYWVVLLTEEEWAALVQLQQKYGNLSNESITVMTSLTELVTTQVFGAFGHDQPLQAFFSAMGLAQAHQLPILPGITSEHTGPSLSSYKAYLERYDVLRRPG